MNTGNALRLPWVLRVVSVLVVLMGIVRYVVLDALLVVPFGTVGVLLALSFAHRRWPRLSAGVAVLIALTVPVMVLRAYLNGNVELALVVFDWVIFGWVVLSAATTFLTTRDAVAQE